MQEEVNEKVVDMVAMAMVTQRRKNPGHIMDHEIGYIANKIRAFGDMDAETRNVAIRLKGMLQANNVKIIRED